MNLTRLKHYGLWFILTTSLVAVGWQITALYRIYRDNSLISRMISEHGVQLEKRVSANPELRLARASYLKHKLRYDEALETLNLILDQGDAHFQARVRYNLGNLYLVQAIASVETMAINQALPEIGLAKQAYRQALALDSNFWDAKYNLEVALRLLPEMDRGTTKDDNPQNKNSQLWTTVPGFPRGLP
ncbi:MAG: MxaK protein [Gammaproteobacteria bacterium HGW-Gammaproteobacteria-3]|jgi:mxaK protein|nr:MAG: MxaK protein [Gammaproteobacteria bacterium HGW-Gammaproteobacteria-3]